MHIAKIATASNALVEFCLSFKTEWFGSYRPERHYMRGPGPKWHEKHGLQCPEVCS
jgi:hypothetical protein